MTGEVLSSGPDPDRPPRLLRWPRRLRPAVLVLVPLVAAGLVVRGVAGRDGARGPSPAPSSFGPSATVTAIPSAAAALPHLVGPPGAAPAGLAMLVSGRGAGVFNPVTGLVTALAGLPSPPGADVGIVRSGSTQAALVSSRDGSASLYVHTRDVAGFRPAGHPASVLAAPAGGLYVMSGGDPQTIEERDARFGLRWRRPLRGGVVPLMSTRHGLVVGHEPDAGTAELQLISPRTLHVRRSLGKVASFALATDGDRLGYVPAPCPARSCVLRMLDLRTSRARSYRLPAGRPFGTSSLSPDGRTLALGWYGEHDQQAVGRRSQLGFVATCDLATGRWERVPGLDTPAKDAADLGWAADGRLVLSVRFPGLLRFAVWRPGDRQLSVLPGSVETAPDSYVSAAVLS